MRNLNSVTSQELDDLKELEKSIQEENSSSHAKSDPMKGMYIGILLMVAISLLLYFLIPTERVDDAVVRTISAQTVIVLVAILVLVLIWCIVSAVRTSIKRKNGIPINDNSRFLKLLKIKNVFDFNLGLTISVVTGIIIHALDSILSNF